MNTISDRINNLLESATLKMAQLARELKAEGKDVISLSLGEPDFDTPQHIVKAAEEAASNSVYHHYSPVPGLLELREAISQKLQRDNEVNYSANQIVVSTGAKQSLMNVVLCLVNPGDEVVVPSPYWVSYAAMVQLAEGEMVNITTSVENDFKITPEQLEAAISPKTKLFLFSSPCNPSGSLYTKEELGGLVKVFEKYPAIQIISDEIYEYITFEGKHESIAQFESVRDRVIIVNGCSKGYAMTGWRIGYIAAPLAIAKACTKMQGQFTSGACGVSQKAATAAISGDLSDTYAMRDAFNKRRGLIISLLKEIDGFIVNEPKGAFYIFPDVSAYFGKSDGNKVINDADDLSMYLLQDNYVSVVTGSAFGSDNCIRISYAASEETIREAVKRMKSSLAKLN